jgi:hypothetical protein
VASNVEAVACSKSAPVVIERITSMPSAVSGRCESSLLARMIAQLRADVATLSDFKRQAPSPSHSRIE